MHLTFCILRITRMAYLRVEGGVNGNTEVKNRIWQINKGIHKYEQL